MTDQRDTRKYRELSFQALPPEQAGRACALLGRFPALHVERIGEHAVRLVYDVRHYTLEELESILVEQGFHLELSLLSRLRRALAYHCERVQRGNMTTPEPCTKNYKAFIEAWPLREHGDHDTTPQEWRRYK